MTGKGLEIVGIDLVLVWLLIGDAFEGCWRSGRVLQSASHQSSRDNLTLRIMYIMLNLVMSGGCY